MKAGVILLLGMLFTINAVAQGTVNFANSTTTRLTTNGAPGGPIAPAGQYTIGLYIAPQGTTDPNAFSLVTPTVGNGAVPGLFNGNGGTNLVIPGNTGQFIAFQVRAWTTSAGATYEDARANLSQPNRIFGVSAIGEVKPATGLETAPLLFGTSAGQVGGFVLGIPEPSSTALLLLGAAGLGLWRFRFRRR